MSACCGNRGRENPDGFRFAALAGCRWKRPRRRGQRNIFTVLFCDAVGSTASDPDRVAKAIGAETAERERGVPDD